MRRSRTLRTAVIGAVLVTGLVTGLAGCKVPGNSDAGQTPSAASSSNLTVTPQQLVSAATKKSQEASTAKFSMSTVIAASGGTIRIYAKGQIDDAAKAMAMFTKLRMPGLGNLTMRQRMVGGQFYMSGIPGAGNRWVKLDAAQAKQYQQGTTANPADQLALFEKLSDGVTEVGPATVGGVATTKYSGTLNLSKPATADESAELKQARKDFADAGLTSVPFTYYIDGKGLLARMSMSMDMTAGAEPGKMVLSMNFTDWGKPVSITAPRGAITSAQLGKSASKA